MKRNTVVIHCKPGAMNFSYGRIIRLIGDDKAEVVDCGRFIYIAPLAELEDCSDYKGYIDHNGHWRRMPTLRKLKQYASRYYDVWRKQKRRRIRNENDVLKEK